MTSSDGFDDPIQDELDRKFALVRDRESFLAFIKALVADREDEVAKERQQPHSAWAARANGWEHNTIEGYLEAAVAYAESSRSLPAEPSWQAFAAFLYSGKYYE